MGRLFHIAGVVHCGHEVMAKDHVNRQKISESREGALFHDVSRKSIPSVTSTLRT